jgi:hypothetical protein
MMAKRPEDRYQSMDEVVQALRRFIDEYGASDSSPRLRRFTESPSGMMRRSALSGERLRHPSDSGVGSGRGSMGGPPYTERSGGSSVIGRELRMPGGSKSGSGGKPRPPAQHDEDLELTVLPDDKPTSTAKPGSSRGGGSTISRSSDSSTAQKKSTLEAPSKPVDFTTWIADELEHAPPVHSERTTRSVPPESNSALLWVIVGAGVSVALLLGVLLIVFFS